MQKSDLIIIGSGPAGLTAAIYAARANLKPLVFEGFQAGGQLMITSDVENWPGFKDGIQGPELMAACRAQAERFGTEFVGTDVTKVELTSGKKIVWEEDTAYEANAVIISTGATANLLGLEKESLLMGRGVSACAICDGFFFKDKVVCVVGGGDSAMEESNFLTRFASKVFVIHRRDEFRASKIMVERVQNNPKIKFILNSVVDDILGQEKVEGVRLKNTKTNQLSDLKVDGMFVAIGHTPNTSLFRGIIEMDDKGYIITAKDKTSLMTATNISGVFACGDVQDQWYRQAITAAGSGCMAAMDAEYYLEEINPEHVVSIK